MPPLDAGATSPYMPRTMIRLLLTFLALVSGFVAEGSPAQARLFAGANAQTRAEAGVVQAAAGAETQAVAHAQVCGFARHAQIIDPGAPAVVPALTAQVSRVTSVLIRIDRALA